MSRKVRVLRWILVGVALGCLLAAAAAEGWYQLTKPEKGQFYYFAGHWFDVLWEVEIPLVAAGALALFSAWRMGRARKPS
jgi:hypothetical protein